MKNNLLNILKKELREMFRDKKSLSMMLIIPIFIPLIMLGMSALFESQSEKDIEEYNKIGFTYELTDAEKDLAQKMDIEIVEDDEKELKEKYKDGEINLYVTKDENIYTLNVDSSDNSVYAKNLAEQYFNSYKAMLQQSYLTQNGVNADEVLNIITVQEKAIEKDNYFADFIKNYAFLFVIMAITVSATYPATDTTAGEKERGTLETLLTFPIKSRDIILGKFLSVTLSSIITGVISFILAIVSLIIAQNSSSIYDGLDIMFTPTTIFISFLIIVIYSFFISGLCISIAGSCKTFKEAQSALTPLTFVSLFPGMIAFMISVKTSALLSIVPFLNYSLIFTDVNAGNINLLNIILMIFSSFVYIAIVLYYIIKQYKSEKVLF